MKKTISLLLTLVLVVSMAAGCQQKETARDALKASYEAMQKISTITTQTEMMGEVSASEEVLADNPSMKGMMDTINAGKVMMTITQDMKNFKSNGSIGVEANGMSFKFDMFMNSINELVFKTPFNEKYITLNNADAGAVNTDSIKKLQEDMAKVILDSVEDSQLAIRYDEEFEGKDGKEKLNYVTITFNNEQFYAFLSKVVDVMYTNEEVLKSMKASIKKQAEAAGQEISDEEIDTQVAEAVKKMPEAIDQAKKVVTFNNVTMEMGLNKDKIAKVSKATLDLNVKNTQSEGQEINAKVNINGQSYDINKPYEDQSVEITEENSISFQDFIMQMMFGGGLPQ